MARSRRDARRNGTSFLGLLLVAVAAIPGCGYGTGLGSPDFSDHPQSANLQVRALTPTTSGRTIRWRITARIADPNNDVIGGTASVSIYRLNDTRSAANFPNPAVSMPILKRDLVGDRFSAILVVHNAPAGELVLFFNVDDTAGNFDVGDGSFTVRISGRTAPRSATRPEELRWSLAHG